MTRIAAKKNRPSASVARTPAVASVSAEPNRPPWKRTRTIGACSMIRPTLAGTVTNAMRRSANARWSLNGPRSASRACFERSGRIAVAIETAKPPRTSSFSRFA